MRNLIATALLLLVPGGVAAEEPFATVLVREAAFVGKSLRLRPDLVEVAPYGAPAVFGEELYSADLRFDLARREARLRLGAGHRRFFALHLSTDVRLDGPSSRVHAR